MIPNYNIKVQWTTGKYDGMLSGYVKHNNKLHFAECVDETHFTRDRMFPVYELSLIERVLAWIRYFKWEYTVSTRWAWQLYCKLWNRNLSKKHAKQLMRKQNFIDTHKIVGYFVK